MYFLTWDQLGAVEPLNYALNNPLLTEFGIHSCKDTESLEFS